MGYDWNFGAVFHHYRELMSGLEGTVKLIVVVLAIALPVGAMLAVIRVKQIPVLRRVVVAYIDFFRTSVALVLVCWCYYALPVLVPLQISTFAAVVIALSLQASAFAAEIFRSGIESVASGQWEAARALGFSESLIMRFVVGPQAIRRVLPVLFVLIVEVTKNTALAGVVSYNELFYNASTIASTTYRGVETLTVVGLIYLIPLLGASQFSRWLERRLARAD